MNRIRSISLNECPLWSHHRRQDVLADKKTTTCINLNLTAAPSNAPDVSGFRFASRFCRRGSFPETVRAIRNRWPLSRVVCKSIAVGAAPHADLHSGFRKCYLFPHVKSIEFYFIYVKNHYNWVWPSPQVCAQRIVGRVPNLFRAVIEPFVTPLLCFRCINHFARAF